MVAPHGTKSLSRFKGTVDKMHKTLDLCVVKLHGNTEHVKAFELFKGYPVAGSTIFTVGAPASTWPSKSMGFVVSVAKSKQLEDLKKPGFDVLLTTVPANPGSSGSPIYNLSGKMVGIIIAVHTRFHHNSVGITSTAIADFTSYINQRQ